jgi:hypothetical protein
MGVFSVVDGVEIVELVDSSRFSGVAVLPGRLVNILFVTYLEGNLELYAFTAFVVRGIYISVEGVVSCYSFLS